MPYQRRDYFKERFTRDELADLLARAGITPHEALSTRSRSYKALGLGERQLSGDELLDLMVQEPTLLRRPLIVTEHGSMLGYNRERLQSLVGDSNSTTPGTGDTTK